MNKFCNFRCLGSLLSILSAFAVTSALASDFQSPRTVGLGGAGHAAPMLTDSIYLNPAYASFLPAEILSVNYGFYHGGGTEPDGSSSIHGHILNGSVQDGRSELFQAGVGGTIQDWGKEVNIGASKSLFSTFGLGLGGKMIFPNAGNGDKAQDAIFSSTFIATSWFQTAAVIDNLIDSPAVRAQGLYREYILGTKFNVMNIAFVYFDPHLAPNIPGQPSFGYESGLELTPMTDLFFRFGKFRNSNIPELYNARGDGYGFGVGWIGPRISLDYGLKRVLTPVSNNTQNFGMTVFF